MVVNVSGGTSVGVVGKAHEGGGGVSTGYSTGVHFTEHHASGFDEAERGVDSEELTGRARAKGISVIHAKPVRYPIELVTKQLGKFVSAIGGGGERLLQLVVS
jgi:hypothetical protein